MMYRAMGLSEQLEKPENHAVIFGEALRLEDGLSGQLLELGKVLEGYVDEHQIEHIRLYAPAEDEQNAQLWEHLQYQQEEAPLELLLPEEIRKDGTQ